MKEFLSGLFLVAFVLILIPQTQAFGAGTHSTKSYYRKDGTYVRGYTATNPDGNPYNNYSFPGNYNPNTGQITTGNPDTYLRNYYDSSLRSSSVSNYIPSPSYSPYVVPSPTYLTGSATSSLGNIQNGMKIGNTIYCNLGYYSKNDVTCIAVPAHSSGIGRDFFCDFGYVKTPDGDSCRKVPDNGYYLGNALHCNAGYFIDEATISCVPTQKKANATRFNGVDYCNDGFADYKGVCVSYDDACRLNNVLPAKYDTTTGKCVSAVEQITCPAQSHQTVMGTCECDYGYEISANKNACVVVNNKKISKDKTIDKNVKLMADFLKDSCKDMGLSSYKISLCEEYRKNKNTYNWIEI